MKGFDVNQVVSNSLVSGIFTIVNYLPKFIAGLIILLIGIIVASIIKRIIIQLFTAINFENILKKYGIPEGKDGLNWSVLLAEVVRWFVIILFLIPTADVWGLPQIVSVLNTFLLYLPNVFVAAIIGIVGFVVARLVYDLVRAATRSLAKEVSQTIAASTRIAIQIFVVLAVLNQLGVATDLIRILFTGLVAMVAIAGGISFGLGGKDLAKDVLENFRKKLRNV